MASKPNLTGRVGHDRYAVGLGYTPSGQLYMDMAGEVHVWIDGKFFARESEQDNHVWCYETRYGVRFERRVKNYDNSHSLFFVTPALGLLLTVLPTLNPCDAYGEVA